MKIKTAGHASILLGLVLSLSGCGYKTTTEAIQAWKAQGKTEKIIELLSDPLQSVRLEAIQALGEIRTKDAIDPLAALFSDPDKVVVHEAIDALVEIGGPEIEPCMLQAITLDTVPARVAGATALGNYKSSAAVDALIIALDDYKYEQIVLAAIKSLGQIGDPRAVDPLCKKLKERSYDIREACINSLYQIGDEAAIKGIASRLGDASGTIRDTVVSALQDSGAASAPAARVALRNENPLARAGAIAVLNGIGAVPESGSDLVWYRLSELTIEDKTVVDPVKADVFASIEDSIPGLLEGVMHSSPDIREYAFIALENMGEDVVETAIAMAEEKATEKGLTWFNQRSEWSGAPSWRIDLWGAVTALNPKFRINPVYVELLAQGGIKAEKLMTSEHFRPRRENIPFLLFQLEGVKEADPCRTLAMEHLAAADYQAVFPLVAALNAADRQIATRSAQVLNTIGGARVEQFVVDEYVNQLDPGEEPDPGETLVSEEGLEVGEQPDGEEKPDAEETPVVVRRNPGEELSGTPLHHAILEFDIPALEPLLMKIRPDATVVIQAFKAKHPDVKVTNVPLDVEIDPALNAVPFRLSYKKNGQTKELKVIYRLNEQKNWIMNPPIPDELP